MEKVELELLFDLPHDVYKINRHAYVCLDYVIVQEDHDEWSVVDNQCGKRGNADTLGTALHRISMDRKILKYTIEKIENGKICT